MAENMSLADQAVQALAMVKAMDDGIDIEHPERHAIRNMQRVARQVIEAGLRSAIDLAWQAQDLRKLARDVEASALEIAATKTHNAPREARRGSDVALHADVGHSESGAE